MIKCHLSRLIGERKLKVADVVRDTGLPRSTITALWKDTATRIELPMLGILCQYFDCTMGELLEYHPYKNYDEPTKEGKKSKECSGPVWYMKK
ncbi:helix-turn-helix transcriptional regulator [Photorhabdus tasmaniensis]